MSNEAINCHCGEDSCLGVDRIKAPYVCKRETNSEDGIGTDEAALSPLTVLCDFCGSKPFYRCINRETQKPMPFFHIARTVSATKQVQQLLTGGPAEGTSSLEPIRKDEVIEWLHERQLNAQRIADSKAGEDRIGWMEDAHFFESAISHMREESK